MQLSLGVVVALFGVGLFAGCLGALVGIGGGIVLVPTLVLAFGVDIKVAVATSLIAVVATSTSAGSVYVGNGLANMRLGMSLEIATTVGGITGGVVAVMISPTVIAALFSVMMLVTAVLTIRKADPEVEDEAPEGAEEGPLEGHEEQGRLAGSYVDAHLGRRVPYEVHRLPLGSAISFTAGILSGMLGVGGGFIKVPAMNLGMRVPIKVAAATSNFMIGVTAISSLFVYFARGLVHPLLACPVAIGVVGGAFSGTALAHKVSPGALRKVLALVLLGVAVQMALKAFGVSLGR
jgi:uncharacterized membrane protein YfcA